MLSFPLILILDTQSPLSAFQYNRTWSLKHLIALNNSESKLDNINQGLVLTMTVKKPFIIYMCLNTLMKLRKQFTEECSLRHCLDNLTSINIYILIFVFGCVSV